MFNIFFNSLKFLKSHVYLIIYFILKMKRLNKEIKLVSSQNKSMF